MKNLYRWEEKNEAILEAAKASCSLYVLFKFSNLPPFFIPVKAASTPL